MNLFLAWSGTRSYKLATAFAACLREVFPAGSIRYFLSSEIEPGTRWFDAVERALRDADAIVVFLTPDNVRAPWTHFETGVLLGEHPETRVFLYLLGVSPGDLRSPLNAFQASEATEDSTRLLFASIYRRARESEALVPSPADLETALGAAWARLERDIARLSTLQIDELIPGFARLFQRKTFQEPINECVDQNWLDRYYGARQTLDILQQYADPGDSRWRPYQRALLAELVTELDGYVREIRKFLIREVQFPAGGDGHLDLTRPKPLMVEQVESAHFWPRRPQRILQAVLDLQDPAGAPVLDESLYFLRLRGFAQKKACVQRKETEILVGDFTLKPHEARACLASPWDYDRIVLYLLRERGPLGDNFPLEAEKMARQIEVEVERLRAHELGEASAMPLHYAIRALTQVAREDGAKPSVTDRIRRCCNETLAFIEQAQLDRGGQMRERLDALSRLLGPA